jgi:transposase, IS5 family
VKADKLRALSELQVQCISKGKARNPYALGVKVCLALTHKHALMVGARS